MDLTTFAAIVVINAALSVASQSSPDLPDDFAQEVNVPASQEPSEVGSAVEQLSGGDTRRPAPAVDAPAEPLPEPTCIIQQVAQSSGPLLTLYTTDGSFPCSGCEFQQRVIAESNIADGLISVMHVDAATASSMGGVPRWETYDKTTRASGVMKAGQLVAWLEMLAEHRGDRAMAFADIEHCEPTLDAVMAALACHLSEDAGQQPFGALIKLDVDAPDDITASVFRIIETGAWKSEASGVALSWPKGKRTIAENGNKFNVGPAANVSLTKWKMRFPASITAVEYDTPNRSVTLWLSGAPDLTVRFK